MIVAVLSWIGIVLGALLALLVLFLALFLVVPFEVAGAWQGERRWVALAGPGLRLSYNVADRMLEIDLFSRRVRRWRLEGGERSGRRKRRKRKRERKRSGLPVSLRSLWRDRRRIGSALRAFLRRLRVRRFSARAVIASPDPALTGLATGMAYAGWGALPARFRRSAQVLPDFEGETPRLEIEGAFRLQPLFMAVLAVRLWRIVRRARRARSRRGRTDTRAQPARGAGERNEAS